MARWADVAKDEPGFAAEVQHAFDAFTHKTVATLRADGSPPSAVPSASSWTATCGSAACRVPSRRRTSCADPRFALHCGTGTASGADWRGDAKLAWPRGGDQRPRREARGVRVVGRRTPRTRARRTCSARTCPRSS
ncbi:hypothetical protein ACU686_08305 [Yinghuangia aomiensis]